ncbi:MAG: hypothetical protein GF317_01415 [Candidatus Lokiarchaeota archaeon]|nr:hypothetical protein [Candidatus Lokiarchaeota archaeon]MBD3198603.1 hypothetical protein [Candidatus Lokiarchaeota archaeon]
MKNKNIIISFFICVSVIFLEINSFPIVNADILPNSNLYTDKAEYYFDESISINASWFLETDNDDILEFLQLRILDSHYRLIWNSSKFFETGSIEKSLTVTIKELEFYNDTDSNEYIVSLYHYELESESQIEEYLNNKSIQITFRDVICRLDGWKERIIYNEQFMFTANFNRTIAEDQFEYLRNHTVLVSFYHNNSRVYNISLQTNNFGAITLNLTQSAILGLGLGQNIINLTLTNSHYFNCSTFIYSLQIDQIPLFYENIEDNFNHIHQNVISVKIYYYFYKGNVITPLINKSINICIYKSNITIYDENHKTNEMGHLILEINVKQLSIEENQFNLTIYLENKASLTFTNNIINYVVTREILEINAQNGNSESIVINFIIIISMISIVFYLIIKKNFKNTKTTIENITIRY